MDAGLYVHIPFCARKCLYCDFVSRACCDAAAHGAYAAALLREFEARAPLAEGYEFSTVYFGGGTPSLIGAGLFARIAGCLRACFNVSAECEFTVEANPDSVSEDKLAAWLAAGANRLSVGVQSFDDGLLRKLGRVHDAQTAFRAVDMARRAGFENFSLDLMCALPGQSAAMAEADADTAVELGARHVSCYQLQIEEGTPLAEMAARGDFVPDSEDEYADIMNASAARLEARGLSRYEVSNFARPGCESRHNTRYWRRGDYLGFGAAAHSFAGGWRIANTPDIDAYIAGTTEQSREEISAQDAEVERVMLGLRLREGVALSGEEAARARVLVGGGLLTETGGVFAPTARGFEVLNSVILRVLG